MHTSAIGNGLLPVELLGPKLKKQQVPAERRCYTTHDTAFCGNVVVL